MSCEDEHHNKDQPALVVEQGAQEPAQVQHLQDQEQKSILLIPGKSPEQGAAATAAKLSAPPVLRLYRPSTPSHERGVELYGSTTGFYCAELCPVYEVIASY